MSDTKNTITIQLDLAATAKELEKVRKIADNISDHISEVIGNLTSMANELKASLVAIDEPLGEILEGIQKVKNWDVSGLVTGLSSINEALVNLTEQLKAQQSQDLWTSLAQTGLMAMQTTQSIYAQEVNRKKGKYESGKTLSGGGSGEFVSNLVANGDSSSSGIVSGIMSDMGGLMGGTSIDDMVAGMDTLIGKLKETVGLWAAQTAEKAKSRAEDLKIIAMNTIEHVKAFGKMIAQLAASTAQWIADTAARVGNTAAQWAQVAAMTAWQAICTAATAVTTALGAAMTFLTSPIGLVVIAVTALIAIIVLLIKNWDTVKAAALSVWEAIKEAFGKAGEWFKTNVMDPFVNGVKNMVNGVIGFINGLIVGAVDGINSVIKLLNKLKFTIPDWIPGLGGATLGFNLKLLNAPQIPYLAKGAVLPANRPFLAVVGDQRHGTNVEAPLSTIQEAVAVVMDDHIAAMMAGFEALLAEQRATRETIEGIQIGDTVIGRAVDRYRSKMAVVYGTGRV